MRRNLQWRALAIVAVAILALWAVYPLEEKVRLGLGLRGRVHLVLRDQTDDALLIESEARAEQLKERASLDGMALTSATAVSSTEIRIVGVPVDRDQEFGRLADDLLAGYNRTSSGGGVYAFQLRPAVERECREESVRQALQTIERRVNER